MGIPRIKTLILAFLCFAASGNAWGQTLQIDRLKAQYLVAFMDFARWDEEAKSERATIGVLANKDFAHQLSKITQEKTEGRFLEVLQLEDGETERLDRIDILFVGAGFEKQWTKIKDHCKRYDILLVGERSRFLDDGGAIQFTLRKNRLRFAAVPENALRQGIELSSTLLELAVERQ